MKALKKWFFNAQNIFSTILCLDSLSKPYFSVFQRSIYHELNRKRIPRNVLRGASITVLYK